MKLQVKRIARRADYTIGRLYIDGSYICDTLEDCDRGLSSAQSLKEISAKKVKGKTAIPLGTYKVNMKTVSPKYSNYSRYPWAKQYHGCLPRLVGVKGFEGILIHVGNSSSDTEGCLLVGENKVVGKLINSQSTFHRLMSVLQSAEDDITIEIV